MPAVHKDIKKTGNSDTILVEIKMQGTFDMFLKNL